jgi:hypothetical protein
MMLCELCGKKVEWYQPFEYQVTRRYYECDGWKTATDEYIYAHKDCIVGCNKR